MSKFTWPAYPKTEAEFNGLMEAIDTALTEQKLEPCQRPLHIGFKLHEALGLSGRVFPPRELATQPGYEGDVLMAKAHAWYELRYGDLLNMRRVYGYAPARLGNALWRVGAGVSYGHVVLFVDRNLHNTGVQLGTKTVPASHNVLCDIDGLTQPIVNSLSKPALQAHLDFHVFMHGCLQWRDALPETELFAMAKADYDMCTVSVLQRHYNQAAWNAQQAIEKTLKGLLRIGGTSFPTGATGHNLLHVAGLLKDHHGIQVDAALLDLAACAPKVRYGEESVTDEQALQANHACLGVLERLRKNPRTAALLSKAPPRRSKGKGAQANG